MCRVIGGNSTQNTTTHPHILRHWRRRSADVGGLHLATSGAGQGQGWMGGEPVEPDTDFAELLTDMFTETRTSVNDNSLDAPPLDLPESARSRLIHSLDRWNFEPHLLLDDELQACAVIMFEALLRVEGMSEIIPLTQLQISTFIHHLRKLYRGNTYHNFEHAVDVLQAVQSYLKSAGMVPPPTILFEPHRTWRPKKAFDNGQLVSCLGLRELFILYVAAIGHDVAHPGVTNGFMKNTNAPLSVMYAHTSPLENMHCHFLLQAMRHNGLSVLLEDPQYGSHVRKILVQSVLATDMGVHEDFMQRLHNMLNGESGTLCQRQMLICQAILKNADISNPTRPFLVSRHWANALMQEWIRQASFEQELQMKPSVPFTDGPLAEAGGQKYFISAFAKPLLELTERAIPEMNMYKTQCKSNLKAWTKKLAILEQEKLTRQPSTQNLTAPPLSASSSQSTSSVAPSPTPTPPPPSTSCSSISGASPIPPPISPRPSDYFTNAFRMTLPKSKSHTGSESLFDTDTLNGHAPASPTESESVSSILSPASESSSGSASMLSSVPPFGRTSTSPSTAGSSTAPMPSAHEVIRAASKVGTLRHQSSKIFHTRKDVRSSWCAPLGDSPMPSLDVDISRLLLQPSAAARNSTNPPPADRNLNGALLLDATVTPRRAQAATRGNGPVVVLHSPPSSPGAADRQPSRLQVSP
ncbi:hypothetical protein D9619_007985 [Psilocybe cf. subviscida]|uniref:Phosphodiesterase n=1 Tax=Psilocybe cf. subviscida TaxID=2480587 RepID=A0A8H5AUF9_9AGAR|nr:hypothetical protein D9619_007985 [Psilocybe cf. subviscida]